MWVIIVTSSDEFPIEVSHQESILDIKQKITNMLGIPVASQTLAVLGFELIDGLDMDDYPIINDGTRINLTVDSIDKPSPDQVVLSMSLLHIVFVSES